MLTSSGNLNTGFIFVFYFAVSSSGKRRNDEGVYCSI